MSDQLARLERKAAELEAMAGYLRAKLAWLEGGEKGPEPDFAAYVTGGDELELPRLATYDCRGSAQPPLAQAGN